MHWKLKNRQRALWYGVSPSRNLKTISHKNQHSDTRDFLNIAKQIPGAHTLAPSSISKPGYDELTCEQALRGAMTEGREKEGELSCNYVCGPNLNICIEKVDAKCLLVEMTLVMTSLPLTRIFQCLFTFALIGENLTAQ